MAQEVVKEEEKPEETGNVKYCLKYLNGKLGQKPDIMKDFDAVEDTLMIKGAKQKTIVLQPKNESNFVSDVDTKFDRSSKIETQSIVMSTKNKKGKDVKDYTLIVKRDEQGNITEIKKHYAFRDFRPVGDKIEFETKNGICIPNEQNSGIKRDFNASLCHELEEFFAKNKDAAACMKSGYEKDLRNRIGKYQQIYKPFMNESLGDSLLLKSGHELNKCKEAGLYGLTVDEKVWAIIAPPEVTPTPVVETEED